MKRWAVLFFAAACAAAQAQNVPGLGRPAYNNNVEEEAPWQEQKDVEPPVFPKKENLREFYVSAVATNQYLIDASTLAVGSDGVVRYVLVVQTSGGATNVSFEGINCKDRTWKHYATGDRENGTWTKVACRSDRVAAHREQAGQPPPCGAEPRLVLSAGQCHQHRG
jgi:hypothetical protein